MLHKTLEMKFSISCVLVLMAISQMSADRLITEDSGPCVLYGRLNEVILFAEIFYGKDSLVSTREEGESSTAKFP